MSKHSNTYKTFNIHENTPVGFYNQLNEEFNFDYDPCPENPTQDGLSTNWGRRCYINPPYGKAIRGWLEKALLEIEKGNTDIAVFLLPAYPDVKWFHEIVLPRATEIRFIKGRLKFGSHNNSAPFASMLVVFTPLSNKSELKKEAVMGFVGFLSKQLLAVGGTWQELELKQKTLDKINKSAQTYLSSDEKEVSK